MMNVVKLKDVKKSQLIEETVKEFVNEAGLNSKETKIAYLGDIKQFIMFTYGNLHVRKDVVVNNINAQQVIKFRSYLINEKKLQSNSINRKIIVIQEFAKYLYNQGYEIDYIGISTVKKLKSMNNSYEVLSYEEALAIMNWLKENEKVMPLEKYYYTALAFDTGVRAEALNSLTPQSFLWKNDEVLIKGIDKGRKRFVKSISCEFANQMFKDLEVDRNSNDKLFNFSAALRYKMMKRAKDGLGWSNRNITFHSFKKGAVNYAYDMTKDIQVAREVGSHASVSTTQIYINENTQAFQGAISNNQAKVDNIKLSDYTREQLIEAILNAPESTQLNVKQQLLNR